MTTLNDDSNQLDLNLPGLRRIQSSPEPGRISLELPPWAAA